MRFKLPEACVYCRLIGWHSPTCITQLEEAIRKLEKAKND